MSANLKRTLAGGIASGLLLISAPAWATDGSVPQAFQAGANTIVKMSKGQAHILKSWTTPAGLYGYAVQIAPGHDLIMYTTTDGKYLFMGGLFNADGKNYSVEYGRKYLPAGAVPHPVTPAQVASGLKDTTNFIVGNPKARKTIWMVADPNCIFCHKAWQKLYPYVQKGDLSIHMIPVGFLKPSSLPKAATILASKEPANAWARDEKGFNDAAEEGSLTPMANIPQEDRLEIQKNGQWMNAHGISGTPFLLYKNPAGGWSATPGMPENVKLFMEQVG